VFLIVTAFRPSSDHRTLQNVFNPVYGKNIKIHTLSLKDSKCNSVWISNHVWILNGRRYNDIYDSTSYTRYEYKIKSQEIKVSNSSIWIAARLL
jgi:hypothetical protein